jgi:hypothetical protein
MVSFPELETWIRAGDSARLIAAFTDLDEPARRSLAGQIKGIQLHWSDPELDIAPHPEPGLPRHRPSREERILRFQQREGALRVAGAACLPRAADVVAWLRSDRFWQPPLPESVDAVVQVLRLPGRPALPAIARNLADKMRPAQADRQWPLIERLLTEAELPPPATEATLRGWMRRVGADRYRKDLADLLREDRHRESMLPHVFTIPLLGQELDEEWTKALTRLAADGVLDRRALLDGCVLRLHAGDRTGPLRRMVVLHRLLDPTAEEFAARRGEYTGMLSSPDSTVAELAVRGLRLADDAGLLEPDTVAEAAWAVLPRKEKKLVRAQLDWLAATLARTSDPLVFEALLTGLSQPATDLAERALKLAARHLPDFGAVGLDLLAGATASLQGDLRRQAAVLFPSAAADGSGAIASPGTGSAGSSPVVAAPMPDPIASIPELAAEAKHLLPNAEDPIRFELLLDALVRFVAVDRPAVARALKPIGPGWSGAFGSMLRAVVTGEPVKWVPAVWERTSAPPFWMAVRRMEELAEQLCTTPPPALLATPATVDGHVDPARVLRLLGEDWEPQPYDLSQALLRLPREIDPEIRAAAARLTSPAGRVFAAFLESGGLPDPPVITVYHRRPCTHRIPDHCGCLTRVGRRVAAFDAIKTDLTVPPYLLFQPVESAPERAETYSWDRLIGWPTVFPSHRELAAAHMQPRLILASEGKGATSDISALPALAACDGPFGPAMALCLAYGMSAARPEGRLATSDAFVDLAARGILDGSLVGRELAALHTENLLVLKRVVDTLTQILQAGAAAQAWAVLREFLPAVLAAPKPAIGTPDLLLTAESAAAAANAHDDLPELAALAARPTRNRVTTEAARLNRTLTDNRREVQPARNR